MPTQLDQTLDAIMDKLTAEGAPAETVAVRTQWHDDACTQERTAQHGALFRALLQRA